MPNKTIFALWQSDREITLDDIAYIRTFTQKFPRLSRTELTNTLCEHLNWLTPAGQPKFTACSKLLLRLESTGEISLPPIQKYSRSNFQICSPTDLSAMTTPMPQLNASLAELDPVRLRPCALGQGSRGAGQE